MTSLTSQQRSGLETTPDRKRVTGPLWYRSRCVLKPSGLIKTQAFWFLDATLAQPQLLTKAFLMGSCSCSRAPLSLLFPTCNSALDKHDCRIPVASGCSLTCFIGSQEKGFRIEETSVSVRTRSKKREEEPTYVVQIQSCRVRIQSMDLRRNRQSLHESTPVPCPVVHTPGCTDWPYSRLALVGTLLRSRRASHDLPHTPLSPHPREKTLATPPSPLPAVLAQGGQGLSAWDSPDVPSRSLWPPSLADSHSLESLWTMGFFGRVGRVQPYPFSLPATSRASRHAARNATLRRHAVLSDHPATALCAHFRGFAHTRSQPTGFLIRQSSTVDCNSPTSSEVLLSVPIHDDYDYVQAQALQLPIRR
ncbi:uncharacterized protein CLUP02_12411 [Colletotrichum lupini]|uniref:Uncharacterized protein n=1 Tax=Colletotrichum lupini TaxID=145971 RepID=A0A9Q8T0A9_9PEZI|nr:uncharacterized protein CLUP02_12411 [Colletotrichum lupini]UQC86909.1 hypothetical protein CLUP02_12411 [Colletotrichum lupini]